MSMPFYTNNWSAFGLGNSQGAGSVDPTRNAGDITKTGETPPAQTQIPQTLADALAAMGMSDYSYMFSGKGSDIGKKLGLTAEQAKKFAQYLTPFQGGQFGDLLSGIPDWQKEQMGMLQEQNRIGRTSATSDYFTGLGSAQSQYDIGTEATKSKFDLGSTQAQQRFGLGTSRARESHGTNVENLRAKAFQDMLAAGGVGQTFESSGAGRQAKQTASDILGTQYGGMQSGLQSTLRGLGEQKASTLAGLGLEKKTSLASLLETLGTSKSRLEDTRTNTLAKLGLSFTAGKAQVEEEADARLGQAYGLLSQYIKDVLGLGSQWAGYDPTGGTGGGDGGGRSGDPGGGTGGGGTGLLTGDNVVDILV